MWYGFLTLGAILVVWLPGAYFKSRLVIWLHMSDFINRLRAPSFVMSCNFL